MKKIYILILILFGCGANDISFSLNRQTYQMWKNFIQPTEQELAWTQISWRTSFHQGLIEGNALERPILLWAMNGHPLGCT